MAGEGYIVEIAVAGVQSVDQAISRMTSLKRTVNESINAAAQLEAQLNKKYKLPEPPKGTSKQPVSAKQQEAYNKEVARINKERAEEAKKNAELLKAIGAETETAAGRLALAREKAAEALSGKGNGDNNGPSNRLQAELESVKKYAKEITEFKYEYAKSAAAFGVSDPDSLRYLAEQKAKVNELLAPYREYLKLLTDIGDVKAKTEFMAEPGVLQEMRAVKSSQEYIASVERIIAAQAKLVDSNLAMAKSAMTKEAELKRELTPLRTKLELEQKIKEVSAKQANNDLTQQLLKSEAALKKNNAELKAKLDLEVKLKEVAGRAANNNLVQKLMQEEASIKKANAALKARLDLQVKISETAGKAANNNLVRQLMKEEAELKKANATLKAKLDLEVKIREAEGRQANKSLVQKLMETEAALKRQNAALKVKLDLQQKEAELNAKLANRSGIEAIIKKEGALKRELAATTELEKIKTKLAEAGARTKAAYLKEEESLQKLIRKQMQKVETDKLIDKLYKERAAVLAYSSAKYQKAVKDVGELSQKERVAAETAKALEQAQIRLARATAMNSKEVLAIVQQYKKLEDQQRKATSSGRAFHSHFTGLNQLTASFRAALTGIGTSFGMYTSGTILAASATYGLVRAVKDTIQVGAEFTKELSVVNAAMNLNAEQYHALEQAAIDLSATSRYGATEVVKAFREMGMSGFEYQEAMEGVSSVLMLASIGMIEFGQASDIATNILYGFGMEATDLARVVDVMAQAVTDSAQNVEQLGTTMSYVAPVASSFGISLEAVTAATEVLVNSGIKSSRAGTGLRRVFMALFSDSENVATQLGELGVTVNNLAGDMDAELLRVLREIYDATNGATTGMGNLNKAVGIYGIPSLLALIKAAGEGAGSLEELIGKLKGAGGAAYEMKKRIEDNLAIDFEKFKAAISAVEEKLFMLFGDSLRDMLQGLTAFIRGLADNTDAIKKFKDELADLLTTLGLVALALLGAGLINTLWKMFAAWNAVRTATDAATKSMIAYNVASSMSIPGVIAKLVGLGLTLWAGYEVYDALSDVIPEVTEETLALTKAQAILNEELRGIQISTSSEGIADRAKELKKSQIELKDQLAKVREELEATTEAAIYFQDTGAEGTDRHIQKLDELEKQHDKLTESLEKNTKEYTKVMAELIQSEINALNDKKLELKVQLDIAVPKLEAIKDELDQHAAIIRNAHEKLASEQPYVYAYNANNPAYIAAEIRRINPAVASLYEEYHRLQGVVTTLMETQEHFNATSGVTLERLHQLGTQFVSTAGAVEYMNGAIVLSEVGIASLKKIAEFINKNKEAVMDMAEANRIEAMTTQQKIAHYEDVITVYQAQIGILGQLADEIAATNTEVSALQERLAKNKTLEPLDATRLEALLALQKQHTAFLLLLQEKKPKYLEAVEELGKLSKDAAEEVRKLKEELIDLFNTPFEGDFPDTLKGQTDYLLAQGDALIAKVNATTESYLALGSVMASLPTARLPSVPSSSSSPSPSLPSTSTVYPTTPGLPSMQGYREMTVSQNEYINRVKEILRLNPQQTATFTRMLPHLDTMAKDLNLNREALIGIMKIESNFNPFAKSGAGAKGLMQVMPKTAKAVADKYLGGFNEVKYATDDIVYNMELGSNLSKELYEKHKNNWPEILADYNGGPRQAAILKRGGSLEDLVPETENYVKNVTKVTKQLEAGLGGVTGATNVMAAAETAANQVHGETEQALRTVVDEAAQVASAHTAAADAATSGTETLTRSQELLLERTEFANQLYNSSAALVANLAKEQEVLGSSSNVAADAQALLAERMQLTQEVQYASAELASRLANEAERTGSVEGQEYLNEQLAELAQVSSLATDITNRFTQGQESYAVATQLSAGSQDQFNASLSDANQIYTLAGNLTNQLVDSTADWDAVQQRLNVNAADAAHMMANNAASTEAAATSTAGLTRAQELLAERTALSTSLYENSAALVANLTAEQDALTAGIIDTAAEQERLTERTDLGMQIQRDAAELASRLAENTGATAEEQARLTALLQDAITVGDLADGVTNGLAVETGNLSGELQSAGVSQDSLNTILESANQIYSRSENLMVGLAANTGDLANAQGSLQTETEATTTAQAALTDETDRLRQASVDLSGIDQELIQAYGELGKAAVEQSRAYAQLGVSVADFNKLRVKEIEMHAAAIEKQRELDDLRKRTNDGKDATEAELELMKKLKEDREALIALAKQYYAQQGLVYEELVKQGKAEDLLYRRSRDRLQELSEKYDTVANRARAYRLEMEQIADLERNGLLTSSEATLAKIDASLANMDPTTREVSSEIANMFKIMVTEGGDSKEMIADLKKSLVDMTMDKYVVKITTKLIGSVMDPIIRSFESVSLGLLYGFGQMLMNSVAGMFGANTTAAGTGAGGVGGLSNMFSLDGIGKMFGGSSIGTGISNAFLGQQGTMLAQQNLGMGVNGFWSEGLASLSMTPNWALGIGGIGGALAGSALFGNKGYAGLGSTIGSTIGSAVGGASSAAISAALGVAIPGVGAIIGGLLGGIAGGGLGSLFGDDGPRYGRLMAATGGRYQELEDWQAGAYAKGAFGLNFGLSDAATKNVEAAEYQQLYEGMAQVSTTIAAFFGPELAGQVEAELARWPYLWGDEMANGAAGAMKQIFGTIADVAAGTGEDVGVVFERVLGNLTGTAEEMATQIEQAMATTKLLLTATDSLQNTDLGDTLNLSDDIATASTQMLDYAKASARVGDTPSQSVQRLLTNIQALGQALILTDQQVDATGQAYVQLSNHLAMAAEAAGKDASWLVNTQTAYYENFFSEEERAMRTRDDALKAITRWNEEVGFSGENLIATSSGLRAYVENLDLTTIAGRNAYISAMEISSAFITLDGALETLNGSAADLEEALKALAARKSDLEIELIRLQEGDVAALAEARRRELAAMDESLHPAQMRIYALEDEVAVLEKAAEKAEELVQRMEEVNQRKADAELALLEAQLGVEAARAEMRNRELAAADEELRKVLLQIYALEDQALAAEKAAEAAQKLADRMEELAQRQEEAEIALIRAQYGEKAARAAIRERELAAADEELRKVLLQIYALEDQALAAEKAAEAAQKLADRMEELAQRQEDAEIALIRAKYGDEAALAETRRREKAATDAALWGILDHVYALEDEARAAEKAAQAAEDLKDLMIRLAEAAGDKALSTRLRREQELAAAADEGNRAILRQIYALEDLSAAADKAYSILSAAVDVERQRINDVYTARVESLNAEKEAMQAASSAMQEALSRALDSANEALSAAEALLSTIESGLDNLVSGMETSLTAATAAQNRLVAWAARKMLPDQKILESTINSASSLTEADFATEKDYVVSQRKTINALTTLKGLAEQQVDSAKAIIAAIEAQSELMKLKEEERAKQIEEQIKATSEWQESELEKLDSMLRNAESQLEAARGVQTEVQSLSDALSGFEAAVIALSSAVSAASLTAQADVTAALNQAAAASAAASAAAVAATLAAASLPTQADLSAATSQMSVATLIDQPVYDMSPTTTQTITSASTQSSEAVAEEIRLLRQDLAAVSTAQVAALKNLDTKMNKWDKDGVPSTRT